MFTRKKGGIYIIFKQKNFIYEHVILRSLKAGSKVHTFSYFKRFDDCLTIYYIRSTFNFYHIQRFYDVISYIYMCTVYYYKLKNVIWKEFVSLMMKIYICALSEIRKRIYLSHRA